MLLMFLFSKTCVDNEYFVIHSLNLKESEMYSESNYMDENKLMMFRRLRNKVRKVTRYRQKCQEKKLQMRQKQI